MAAAAVNSAGHGLQGALAKVVHADTLNPFPSLRCCCAAQVQILWVVTQPQRAWEKRLPASVSALISAARSLNPPTDNSRITGGIQTAGEMILSLVSNIVSKAGEGTWLGGWPVRSMLGQPDNSQLQNF